MQPSKQAERGKPYFMEADHDADAGQGHDEAENFDGARQPSRMGAFEKRGEEGVGIEDDEREAHRDEGERAQEAQCGNAGGNP